MNARTLTMVVGICVIATISVVAADGTSVVKVDPIEDPTVPYYGKRAADWTVRIVGIVAAGALLWTLCHLRTAQTKRQSPRHLPVLIALWAILPPVWFWIEYFFIYRLNGVPGTLEFFKYGQQTAAAIWAGTLAVLLAFGAGSGILRTHSSCYVTVQHALSEIQDAIRESVVVSMPAGLTFNAIVEKTGLPTETVNELLTLMVKQGVLKKDSSTSRWLIP